MTELPPPGLTTWYELLIGDASDEDVCCDWMWFATLEEAKAEAQRLRADGEVVSIQVPAPDWDEDNHSYLEVETDD